MYTPAFGSMSMDDIKAADVRRLILEIEKRGARDVAQRQHGTISQIFRYAVSHELAERNLADDFKPSDVLSSHARRSTGRGLTSPSCPVCLPPWTSMTAIPSCVMR